VSAVVSPRGFASRFCTVFFDFQVAALDYREPIGEASARPVDVGQARLARARLGAALATLSSTAASVLMAIRRSGTPLVRNGRDLARYLSGLAHTASAELAAAAQHTWTLRTDRLERFSRGVRDTEVRLGDIYRRLDHGLGQLSRLDRRGDLIGAFVEAPACRTLGGRWAVSPDSPTKTITGTAAAPTAPVVEWTGDTLVPRLFLPGGRTPAADVAAVTTRTSMTARARLVLYSGAPIIDAGPEFASACVRPEAPDLLALGCYSLSNGRIFVLDVKRQELAGLTDVATAHEMLHAAYAHLTPTERKRVDAMTAAFFDGTTDETLRAEVAQYDKSEPGQRANELHSLIGTEIAQLPPELEAYYAQYFRDRQAVVANYQAVATLFAEHKRQHDALTAQLDGLRPRIEGIKAELPNLKPRVDAASQTALDLTNQIDSLRAQGRFDEANNLIPTQNAAVNEARRLIDQYNGLVSGHNQLIGQYNAIVDQANAIAATDRELFGSLRPAT